MEFSRILNTLTAWMNRENLMDYGAPVFRVLVVAILAVVAFRIINRGLGALEKRELVAAPIVIPIRLILKWIMIVFGVLLALQQAGLSITSVWTTLSAVLTLIAVGFVAVWSILSNFLCTLMLLIFQPFRIGDEIEIIDPAVTGGVSGKVVNINMIFTIVRETDERGRETGVLQIPNNLFFQKIIRRKHGWDTVDLNAQIFEEKSLVNHRDRPESDS